MTRKTQTKALILQGLFFCNMSDLPDNEKLARVESILKELQQLFSFPKRERFVFPTAEKTQKKT